MTAAPSINREVAGSIAALLRQIRPAWDQLTTLNAVHEASRTHRDVADLVAGCIRIAQDRSLRAPTMLLDDESQHWRRTAAPVLTSGPGTMNDSCPKPGHEGYWAHNCPGCKIDERLARNDNLEPPARYHREDDE